MSWSGVVVFGYNGDGYGDYTNALVVDLESANTNSLDETLELVKEAARDWCDSEMESGWEMPYSFNWGDVFEEIDDEYYESRGIHMKMMVAAQVLYHDEEVVAAP